MRSRLRREIEEHPLPLLLAIGLLAIAGMQLTSVRGNFFSSNLAQASILAQDRLEALRQADLDSAALSAGTHDEGTIAGTIFRRRYVVSAKWAQIRSV